MTQKEKIFWGILSMVSMTAIAVVWSLSNAFAEAIVTASSTSLGSGGSVANAAEVVILK